MKYTICENHTTVHGLLIQTLTSRDSYQSFSSIRHNCSRQKKCTLVSQRKKIQGGLCGLGMQFVDIQLKALPQYKFFILKHNSNFNVNKRLSLPRWTTLYFDLDSDTYFSALRAIFVQIPFSISLFLAEM